MFYTYPTENSFQTYDSADREGKRSFFYAIGVSYVMFIAQLVFLYGFMLLLSEKLSMVLEME